MRLAFDPSFIPNELGGTDIFNGAGEKVGFTLGGNDYTAFALSGYVYNIVPNGRTSTDGAAIQAILEHLATH